MAQYKILTDTNIDLSAQMTQELDIHAICMRFVMGEKEYENYADGRQMAFKDYYVRLRGGETSTTNQISMEQFKQAAVPYLQQGIDVLHLSFSSGLSGSYNTCCIAAQDLKEEFPDRKIIVVDTLGASMGQGLVVWHAVQEKNKGKTIDEVAKWVQDNRLAISSWFTVNDLNHLKRGGRLSGSAALLGTMLDIKPILTVTDEGKLVSSDKVRGRRKSLDALVQKMQETAYDPENNVVFISHADCEEDANYVKQKIEEELKTKQVYVNFIGPVIGGHSGPGAVALFFASKKFV